MRWSSWRSAGTSGTACPTGPGACSHKRGLDVDHVIDVLVSGAGISRQHGRFFTTSLAAHLTRAEVITDRAPALANVIQLWSRGVPQHRPVREQPVRCDHGRLNARLRPMRGLKTDRTASVVIRGHAFIQNLRRGHDQLGVEVAPVFRLATAIDELQLAI